MITTRYYYEKLNNRDKEIYKAIYDGIMHYKQYVEVPGISLNEAKVGWVYHCVLWDNPFIFSVGEYAMWHALDKGGSRIKMTTLILSVPDLQKMSDFQKEVFVHDFVINNIKYDETLGNNGSKIEPYTVYGALVEHKAVCEGIAKTVKLLLNMLDVKCIVVSGTYEGHRHAWNIVKLDDWAYNLDVTMDMGRVIHKGKMRYNYFNFRDSDFDFYNPDNAHMLPECKAIKNNYLIKAGGFVSNRDRLKKYIKNGLSKRKTSLYFKINRNVQDQYSKMSFEEFQAEVNSAYEEVANHLGISTKRFVDTTGPGEIINVEIEYL